MRRYDFTQLTVLIVDDNLMMRRLVERILNCFGVRSVLRAANGDDALHILANQHIDMAITDWMMEPTDGFEFVRIVRTADQSRNRLVPILMMTGHTEMWRVAAARDAGINEFIVKPITSDALLSRMIYMIENPRAYVRTGSYFGPDRRRKADFPYFGPDRRSLGKAKGDALMNVPSPTPTSARDNARLQDADVVPVPKARMPA